MVVLPDGRNKHFCLQWFSVAVGKEKKKGKMCGYTAVEMTAKR